MATIRKRTWNTPSGKTRTAWQVDWRDGLNKRRSKQFPTREAAKAFAEKTDLTEATSDGTARIDKIAREWVTCRTAEGLERSTIAYYTFMVERYIIPAFGHVKGDQLTKAQVIDQWEHVKATKSVHMGKSFVRHLKMMLNFAEDSGYIQKNVIIRLKTAVRSRTKRRNRVIIPTVAEKQALLEVIQSEPKLTKHDPGGQKVLSGERRRPAFMMMYETGMRPSELRGLPWSSVNLELGHVMIEQRADRWNTIGDCKTGASYRTIPISGELVELVRIWKNRCPTSAQHLVFPTASGAPMSARWLPLEFKHIQVQAGVVAPLLDEKGIPRATKRGKPRVTGKYVLYALRHLRASIWISEKLDLKQLQTRMGHASIQITFDVYGHLIEQGDGKIV